MAKKPVRKNSVGTKKQTIMDQMNEPRPLPMGITSFHEWSDRIISGALIPHDPNKYEIFLESQKRVLASMILHLGPTESHKPDAHFIHSLRKACVNEIAYAIGKELEEKAKARLVSDATIDDEF